MVYRRRGIEIRASTTIVGILLLAEGGFGGLYGEPVASGGFVWLESENWPSRVAP